MTEPHSLSAADKARIRAAFDRAARDYDAQAVLQHQVGEHLDERLELIRLQPQRILDIGTGSGRTAQALTRRYPQAQLVAADLSPAMLEVARGRLQQGQRWRPWRRSHSYAVADIERLPFADASFDLVVSNLTLQWCPDPAFAFEEVRRVLRPEGLFLFTTFGPDTLRELRQAWQAVDGQRHVNPFLDMHDLGDALVRTRFDDPVMDVEYFNLTYPDTRAVMRDLKGIGAQTVLEERRTGLLGREAFQRMEVAYEAQRRDGRLPSTWEVVHGHAWAPKTPQQQRSGETTTVSLAQLRGSVGR